MLIYGDTMASLPKEAIKKLIKKYAKANITDTGADELAKILEDKAKAISRLAVENAKKDNRSKITREDITKALLEID